MVVFGVIAEWTYGMIFKHCLQTVMLIGVQLVTSMQFLVLMRNRVVLRLQAHVMTLVPSLTLVFFLRFPQGVLLLPGVMEELVCIGLNVNWIELWLIFNSRKKFLLLFCLDINPIILFCFFVVLLEKEWCLDFGFKLCGLLTQAFVILSLLLGPPLLTVLILYNSLELNSSVYREILKF